ncbi:MAG: hypothetical protein MI810_10740 [Flavobacteriales bacterium]|nr:hypothetical protein [Flavobacteriales bacterium]
MLATLTEPTTIKRELFEVTLDEHNILHFRYFQNSLIDIPEIKDGFDLYDELVTDPSTVKRLIEMEKYSTVTKEAREYIQEYTKPVVAEALVLPSLALRLMFKFYLKFRKQDYPVQAFKDVNEAYFWLRDQ